MNLFHSKSYNNMMTLMQEKGFFSPDIINFNINSLSLGIKNRNAYEAFMMVISQSKLNYSTLLRTVLTLINMAQVDPRIINTPQLDNFISKLQEKSLKILKKAEKTEKTLPKSISQNKLFSKVENFFNGKNGLSDKSMNTGTSYIVGRVVLPLLSLFQRIKASYQEVYRPSRPIDDDELCWASLNLLKKYVELSKTYEEIGRYYIQEFAETVFFVLSVLDFDIKNLYKRIIDYLKKSIEGVQKSIMEKQLTKLTEEEEEKIKQILMLVGEIDSINDNLRLLYLGKYFARYFNQNGIRMPPLFRGTQIVDFFDQIFRECTKKKEKKDRKGSNASSVDTQTTQDNKISNYDVKKLIAETFGEEKEEFNESKITYFSSEKEIY